MQVSTGDMASLIRGKKRNITSALDSSPHGSHTIHNGTSADCHTHQTRRRRLDSPIHSPGHTGQKRKDRSPGGESQGEDPKEAGAGGSPTSSAPTAHSQTVFPQTDTGNVGSTSHSSAPEEAELHTQTTPNQETQTGSTPSGQTQLPSTTTTSSSSHLNLFRPAAPSRMLRHLQSLRWRVPQIHQMQNSGANEDNTLLMMPPPDPVVMREFDTEVSAALARVASRIMGVDSTDSPGVRSLVARHLTWFQSASDFTKLLALLAAKKANALLAGPDPNSSAFLALPGPNHLVQAQEEGNNALMTIGSSSLQCPLL